MFTHVRYDHPKLLWLDCQSHLQSDMGQCYSQISGIGMTIISWLYAPFIFNPHQFLGLALTGFGVGFSWRRTVVVLRVLDSPILRTVVPGVELQKHTKTEIGLWQGEHSLYTPFQSEVIDMRCCLRLRLSPAFAMRHDISPNCRWLPQVCAKAHFRRQAKHLLLSVLVVCHFSIWYPWYPCRGPKPLSYFIPP